MTRSLDVISLGLNSVDLVTVVAEYPPRNSKQPLRQFAQLPGGQMATAAAVCARLGWRSSYVGAFGDDAFGAASRESLLAEGVDTRHAWTAVGATNQFAVILVDEPSGDRTVLWHRHQGLTIDPARVPLPAVASARVLIVDCHESAAAAVAARHARAAGVRTVVDVEHVRPGVDGLLRHIDGIIAAEAFPSAFTGYGEPGRALAALADEYGAPLVCVTLGSEGSLARCGGQEIRTPGFVVECVDTTGAGDAFRGGFAAGLLRSPDGELEDVLEYANAVAALNCRGLGARGGMPTRGEVEALVIAGRRSKC